jgi:hypothetical protein
MTATIQCGKARGGLGIVDWKQSTSAGQKESYLLVEVFLPVTGCGVDFDDERHLSCSRTIAKAKKHEAIRPQLPFQASECSGSRC